ncbi:tellurite resistance TerB family protein [Psychroflexus aestuariivivens]|uniref:tellurite resistance TerB family protein n=1 Tax=Psychroflexus aestuariivivens TaxID=1795040 RepID=UPI000FD98486|nr:TerB family tellurite resistance protein [Psychroflexus aestuariivivens]
MSAEDIYENTRKSTRINHFANIVNLAASDGKITPVEETLLKRFSKKFDISDSDYEQILENPGAYPVHSIGSKEQRLEYLFDLLKIIFIDGQMDEVESFLLNRYAVGLGFTEQDASEIIRKSVILFSGKFSFETYKNFIDSDD